MAIPNEMPFKKGEDGIRSPTIGPIEPDMYIYYFVIDGVRVADPSNTVAGFTASPPYRQLVVTSVVSVPMTGPPGVTYSIPFFAEPVAKPIATSEWRSL